MTAHIPGGTITSRQPDQVWIADAVNVPGSNGRHNGVVTAQPVREGSFTILELQCNTCGTDHRAVVDSGRLITVERQSK